MGIPHIKLIWGKKIKYGVNMVFHRKSIKNSEKMGEKNYKSRHVAVFSDKHITGRLH